MSKRKTGIMVDFTPALINELESAERLIRATITGPPTGMIVGRVLTESEAEAFKVTADVLLERYLYLREKEVVK